MTFTKTLSLISITAFISLSGCGVNPVPQSQNPPCVQIDDKILKLSGPISLAMQDCVLEALTSTIETVIVNSIGGDVDAGRMIGYRIGEHPRHIIIEKFCLSSCGNYFIPPAHAVELKDDAVIGLHGSPDPQMLSNARLETHLAALQANDSASSKGAQRQLDSKEKARDYHLKEEARFAATFNIPKGWRHYRGENDTQDGWREHFESGTDAGVIPKIFMIVEEDMIGSCLPHVKTNAFQHSLTNGPFKKRHGRNWKTI